MTYHALNFLPLPQFYKWLVYVERPGYCLNPEDCSIPFRFVSAFFLLLLVLHLEWQNHVCQ